MVSRSSSKPAKFVHIGLGKCASTYLQTVWLNEPRYVSADMLRAAKAVRDLALSPNPVSLPKLDLGVRAGGGQSLIATSEGFTWGYINKPDRQVHIPQLHALSAKLLGQSDLSESLLIIVRNPIDWIRAAHEQSIKQRGSQTAAEFVVRQEGLIRGVLDLQTILDAYRPWFSNIVILSAEHLREDPEAFWSNYARRLDVPRPAPALLKAAAEKEFSNQSLNLRLASLAAMNASMDALVEVYAALDLPTYAQQERQAKLKELDEAAQWATRRIAEFGSDEHLNRLAPLFSALPAEDFADFRLGPDLHAHLSERFLAPLRDDPEFDTGRVEAYAAALDARRDGAS